VQHALNSVMAALHLKNDRGDEITSYLLRDGYMGPKTLEAIMAYQRNLKSRSLYVKVDGAVDESSQSGWTGDGNAQFTIVYLNRDHLKINGKMMQEKDFPELLRNSLLATR